MLTTAPEKPHMSKTIFFILNDYNNYKYFRSNLIRNFEKNYKIIIFLNFKKQIFKTKKIDTTRIKFINIKFDNSFNICRFLLNLFKIIYFFHKYKPFSIYTFTIKPNLIGIFLSNFLNIKFIISFTGLGNLFIRNRKIFNLLIKSIILKKRNNNLFFVFHNKTDLKYFKDTFNFKNLFKVNGSGISLSKKIKQNQSFKKIKILCISRPLKEKGFNDFLILVNSFKELNQFEFNLISEINEINNDYDKKLLQYLIQSKKINHINKSHNIFNQINKNHLFILLSKREGLSHSMIKCLSRGLPCIALDVAGNKDLIVDGYNGYLIKDNNKKILNIKKRILSLCKNKNQYIELSKNAQYSINNSFSHNHIFRFYRKFLI